MADLFTGALAGAVMGEMVKRALQTIENGRKFGPTLETNTQTLTALAPLVEEMMRYNEELDRPREEIEPLLSHIREGEELVRQSKKLSLWRFFSLSCARAKMMKSRPRSDLYINLPALQKLDTMLIEILDTFEDTEFWYAENIPGNSTRSPRAASFRKIVPRKDEKWWLPVPCVLPGGLSDKSRKHLIEKRDCANQIHKAAMAINSNVLAEIDIPETYIDDLPKLTFYCQVIEDSITCDPIKQMSWNFSSNFISLLWKPIIAAETCRKRDDITSYKSGRASLGDSIYHYMNTADKFSPDHLLEFLKISSEHEALDLVDRVESSMYTWRRKACLSYSKSSWKKVKDLMADTDCKDKNYILAERAETLLFCLKQRYPELSQTSLDTTKIQYNRDVGKAVLESYSRVLEGLAFNIVAWVEDVLDVDKSMRNREV